MIGYKVVNGDLTAFNHFQYEIGKTYDTENKHPEFRKDLHFFERLEDTEQIIDKYEEPRILVVDSLNSEVKTPVTDPKIRVSTKLKILKELDYASIQSQDERTITYFALLRTLSKERKRIQEYIQHIRNKDANIMIPFNYIFYEAIKEDVNKYPEDIFEIVKMTNAYWVTEDFLRRTRSKIFANALLRDEKTRETLLMSCGRNIIENLCDDELIDDLIDNIDSDYAIAKIIETKKSRKYIEKYIHSDSQDVLEAILNVGTKEDIDFIVTERFKTITTENAYNFGRIAAENPDYIEPFFNKAYESLHARITYYRAIILYADKALIPRIYKMLKTKESKNILEEILTSILMRGIVSINKQYMDDERQNIRSIIADSNRYFADRMHEDKNLHVRMACASRCSKNVLKILMHDKNLCVQLPCIDRLSNKDLDLLCKNVEKVTMILYILESRDRTKDLVYFANHPSRKVRSYILKQKYKPAIKILAKGDADDAITKAAKYYLKTGMLPA